MSWGGGDVCEVRRESMRGGGVRGGGARVEVE